MLGLSGGGDTGLLGAEYSCEGCHVSGCRVVGPFVGGDNSNNTLMRAWIRVKQRACGSTRHTVDENHLRNSKVRRKNSSLPPSASSCCVTASLRPVPHLAVDGLSLSCAAVVRVASWERSISQAPSFWGWLEL